MTKPKLTLEGLTDWLKTQDPATEYNYLSNSDCLIARFARHLGYEDVGVAPGFFYHGTKENRGAETFDPRLDRVAHVTGPGVSDEDSDWTYGSALKRAAALL